MKIYHGITEVDRAPLGCVATIGNFDGVYLGHRKIFEQLISAARVSKGAATVITFKPHPQIALRPEKHVELLNTYSEKLDILKAVGIDVVVEEPFSREFSNTSPEDFVQLYLIGKLDVKTLFLGYDFAFGKERKGSAALVRELAQSRGMEVIEVPPFIYKGEPVSSSRIRRALDVADIPLANELLGRPFFVRGVVVKGQGRGRTIQVPTANLSLEWRKLPRIGVYATRTKWRDQVHNSVTNVGVSPTFRAAEEEPNIVVETHILDFQDNVYGHTLDVEFLEFLRPEKKFAGPTELVIQIKLDIENARAIHAKGLK